MSNKSPGVRHFLLFSALILAPAILGLARDTALKVSAKRNAVHPVAAATAGEKACESALCRQVITFEVPESLVSEMNYPALGYYSAFADSYVSIDGRPLGPIEAKSDLSLSWFKFHVHTIPTKGSGSTRIDVHCLSPLGTKKIGMDHPVLLIGNKRSLDALAAVFDFFSIHIYLVAAFIVLALGTGLLFTDSVRKSEGEYRLVFQTLVVVFALFFYSHFFDQLLIDLGIPKHLVELGTRLFIGPALAVLFIKSRRLCAALCITYLILFAPSLFAFPFGETLVLSWYRWLFVLTAGIFGWALLQNHVPLVCGAFLLLLLKDSLTLHGLTPLTSGLYTWVLGLPGLFVVANVQHL